jgi:hypothetical protein
MEGVSMPDVEYFVPAHLLVNGNVRALQTSPHTPSAKAALCNLPKTIGHCLEYELVGRITEAEAASVE